MSAEKLQAVRDGAHATAELLEHHTGRLRGLEQDVRGQLAVVGREVAAERQIAEDRHLTTSAKLEALEDKLDEVLGLLRGLSQQFGTNGSGGGHG